MRKKNALGIRLLLVHFVIETDLPSQPSIIESYKPLNLKPDTLTDKRNTQLDLCQLTEGLQPRDVGIW